MTGPEHYKEAEKLLREWEKTDPVDDGWWTFLDAAQIHAALATAAAMAGMMFPTNPVNDGWRKVLS